MTAILIVVFTVIIPNGKYNDALALMEAGKYEEAIAAFEAMDGFIDSAEKICEVQYEKSNIFQLGEAGRKSSYAIC